MSKTVTVMKWAVVKTVRSLRKFLEFSVTRSRSRPSAVAEGSGAGRGAGPGTGSDYLCMEPLWAASMEPGSHRVEWQKNELFLVRVSLSSPDDIEHASSWDYRYHVLLK